MKTLAYRALILAGFIGLALSAQAEDQSVSNLKQIGLAIAMYADVHNDLLPDMSSPKAVEEAIGAELVGNARIFLHPLTGEPYQPNRKMNGRKWQEDADAVVCFEASPQAGTRAVLFNDGHVQRLSEERWQQLRKEQGIPEGDFTRQVKKLQNLNAIGIALLEYAKDGDKTLPPLDDLAMTKKALLPYTGMKDVFVQPDTHEPYLANPSLAHKKLTEIAGGDEIVVFFEAKPTGGARGVLYLDGKTGRVPESHWPDVKCRSGIK